MKPSEPQSQREANQQWIGQYGLYDRLFNDEELRSSTSELEGFYAEKASTNMGRMHQAVTSFQDARRGFSAEIVMADIQHENSVEQTLKEVLTILSDNASALDQLNEVEEAKLREIAQRCPLDDGFGVYMARATLLKTDTFPRNYENECELMQPIDIERNKSSIPEETDQFLVYPNPNNGLLTVEYELAEGENGHVQVFDLSGRSIYSNTLNSEASITQINLNGITSGMYLIRIDANGGTKFSQRISIMK